MSVGADANQPEVHANKMARVEDTLRVKKISEHAVLPVRGSEGAAGYDLASAYECGTSRSRASVLAGETRARRASTARLRAPHASTTRDRSTRQLDVFKTRQLLNTKRAFHTREGIFRNPTAALTALLTNTKPFVRTQSFPRAARAW